MSDTQIKIQNEDLFGRGEYTETLDVFENDNGTVTLIMRPYPYEADLADKGTWGWYQTLNVNEIDTLIAALEGGK